MIYLSKLFRKWRLQNGGDFMQASMCSDAAFRGGGGGGGFY